MSPTPPPEEDRIRRGWLRLSKTLVEARGGEFLAQMTKRAEESGVRSLMGPIGCAMIYALVYQFRPRIIVETGGNLGMASSFILKAMQDAGVKDGKLYSIERSKKIVPGSLIPEEIKGPYVSLNGAVEDFLSGDQLPESIDMFLHDSTHRYGHQLMEFERFWPRLSRGGLLASHDVNMNAAFTDFISRTYVHDEGGISIPEKTGHLFWGCFGEIGFAVKA
jgi:predicted O-methyltransferase YrrM